MLSRSVTAQKPRITARARRLGGSAARRISDFYDPHEVLAPAAAVTSAAVSVAVLPAEAGFSLAVPVLAVPPEPPLDGAVVLSDGFGLDESEGAGEGELVVALGLAVGDGLDEMIGATVDDGDPVLYSFVGWLHDGEGPADLDVEERCDGDAVPSVVPCPPGRPPVWEPLPVDVLGATPLVGEMVEDTLCSAT